MQHISSGSFTAAFAASTATAAFAVLLVRHFSTGSLTLLMSTPLKHVWIAVAISPPNVLNCSPIFIAAFLSLSTYSLISGCVRKAGGASSSGAAEKDARDTRPACERRSSPFCELRLRGGGPAFVWTRPSSCSSVAMSCKF